MSASARVFLAFEIPERVRAGLLDAVEAVRDELPRSRWTRPRGWHLTLKFLGETEVGRLHRVRSALAASLPGLGAVAAHLHGSGFFPSSASPRVAWVGGEAEGAARVVEMVEQAAAGAGFPRERRPWSVHLTLARLRSRWPRLAVERFLEWGEKLDLEAFDCSEVVLFESSLEPGGAVYTALERFPLV